MSQAKILRDLAAALNEASFQRMLNHPDFDPAMPAILGVMLPVYASQRPADAVLLVHALTQYTLRVGDDGRLRSEAVGWPSSASVWEGGRWVSTEGIQTGEPDDDDDE